MNEIEVEVMYIIRLSAHDANKLKRILGSLSDDQFAERGIRGEDRERMSELYDMLPDEVES